MTKGYNWLCELLPDFGAEVIRFIYLSNTEVIDGHWGFAEVR